MSGKRFIPVVCLVVMCLALVGQGQETGSIMYEIWDGIGGTAVSNLTGNANFPDNPTSGELLPIFESPTDRADNFGGRLYGWLHPAETADYTFWLAADDGAEVWLSTTDDPADAVLIVSEDSWGASRDWFDRGQKSDPVALTGGEKYYVEALYKEGGGGDNIAVAWQINADPDPNATIDPNDIVVIDGQYLSPAPWNPGLFTPKILTPADGAMDVALDVTAEWMTPMPPEGLVYQIYLSPDEVIDANDLIAELPDTSASGAGVLQEGTTYYLQIGSVDAEGIVRQSPVIMFTTIPVEAHFPSPHDGALWVKTDATLGWTPGLDALVHNVFMSTDQALVAAKDPNAQVGQWLSEASFAPVLEPNTTYFWAVDEFLGAVTNAGPVWSFTTGDPDDGGVLAQYWTNMNLDGAPALITTESEVNWDFNADRNSQPHPDVPVVDNFSARWTADLQVPVTGTYTLYEASDDGSRMFLNGELVAEGWWDRGTTEDTTGPLELVAGEPYLLEMEMYENGGGATAYLRWEGPGIPKQIIPQGALQIPEIALYPTPADGATGVNDSAQLSWIAGPSAVQHDVYMGTDPDLVAAADASVYMGRVGDPNAVIIPVPDGGFDDSPLSDRGYAYIGEGNWDGELDYPGPWQSSGGDAWIDNHYYIDDGDLPALSGNNKLYGNDGAEDDVYQILDETFIAGATYTLSVWTGTAWPDYADSWSLSLTGEDYSNNLAEVSGTAQVGAWEQVSLVYTATADDAGKKIGIKLKGDNYVNFDDVSLSYVVGSNSFDPGLLPWNTVYYWRADGVTADGTVIPAWFLWEFTTQADEVLEDFGSYDIDSDPALPIAEYLLAGDANDTSGNGLDGTISDPNGGLGVDGSVWVDDPERGTVISFNGTAEGAYVRAGEIPQMTLTNDFTWSFWAKQTAENTANNDIILGNRYNEDGVDFAPRQFIKFTPTKFEWHMNGNGNDNLDYDDIPADVWIHHAVVKTGDQLTYYRDGIESSSGVFTQPLDVAQPLYFGGDNTGAAGENWAGLMSEVRIYDYALAPAAIADLAGALNLVSDTWGAGITAQDPNEGKVMVLADGDVAGTVLDADVQGADTLAVMVAGDGQVDITVEDAAGATSTVSAAAQADYQAVLVPLGGLDTAAIATVTVTATGGTVYVAELKATADHQVVLVNPSFELPAIDKKPGFGDVPGWNTDSAPVASGVEPRHGATDGNWTAYLKGRDPAIWNLTNQIIRGEGDTFTLTLDARRIVTGSKYDGAQKLTIVLYYDDAGTRVPLVTKTVGLKTGMKTFSIAFTAPADSPAIGNSLGIELSNKVSLYVGVDNLKMVRDYSADFDD